MTEGVAWERGAGALPFLLIQTDRCRARLTPYGGQLCEWAPVGQAAPVLFLSPRSEFAAGRAIRGGVPICFPWFGAHPSDPTKPAHGFARVRTWQVADISRDHAEVRVALSLASDAGTRALWNAAFAASLTVSLGERLEMTAEIENTGDGIIAYELALHTYLAVGDVAAIRIRGLEGTRFVDKADGMKEKIGGAEPLAIVGETDRVYLDTTATCTVDDPVLRRRIRIAKQHALATVVWNPGPDKARSMPDIGEETWRRFVCLETANCGPHAVRLPPGARHTISARIDVAPVG
jgi:glucose-6-phosphate 1-epimerase